MKGGEKDPAIIDKAGSLTLKQINGASIQINLRLWSTIERFFNPRRMEKATITFRGQTPTRKETLTRLEKLHYQNAKAYRRNGLNTWRTHLAFVL